MLTKDADKRAEALRLKMEGRTYAQIGERLGISRQRAYQLVAEHHGDGGTLMDAPGQYPVSGRERQFVFRMSAAEELALQAAAERAGLTLSEFVRRAVLIEQ